ncbi:glycoside hydrolase family 5 protein [Gilvimarinus sp. DA14]|uniref:glycoside hydrolase family 5 protein n=1 Tax=Gilvimarinus sp. DA14 TaxID=2956798 RepID=UPI0020B683B2|nr:glycoside hydrolase family 5 protein [Gilvimarinus sp. DA14]UTF61591.1 glycoside hydrolase family 5 protein [Gilvimarinus sp. DA14]
MKMKLLPWVVMTGALTLTACGGSDGLLGEDNDVDMMYPEAGTEDPTDRPRPPEGEPTMTTTDEFLLDVAGNPVFLRGVTLEYYKDTAQMIQAIEPIAATGANAVRLMIDSSVTEDQLDGALSTIANNNMVAVVSLTDDGSALHCQESSDAIVDAVNTLWLDQWISVLAQDRYQGRVIINIADGWGPMGVFNASSLGYKEYIDTYKALIRRFREAGFKLPLMIDGANCGQDFNAFLVGRGDELLAADAEKNLIFAADGDGQRWDSADKIIAANTLLAQQDVPFVMNAFGGSETGDFPVDETEFMAQAVGDTALVVDTPWVGSDDGVGYLNAFGETLDLTSGATSLDVFMDRRYLEFMRVSPGSSNYAPNGTTGIAMYLMDENGNRLRLGMSLARELRENVWNKLRFDVPAEIDPANLLDGATEFDQAAVTHVGIEILANGKSDLAEGEIKFDNLNLFPGVPPMYTAEFNTDGDSEGWGGNGADFTTADGSLQALPTGEQINYQLGGSTLGLIDFSSVLNVTVRMFLPEEYSGDGLWGQAFAQFCDDWSAWNQVSMPVAQLVPGQWSELKFNVDFSGTNCINTKQSFGLQLGGISLPKSQSVLIDSIVIEDPSARPTKIVTDTQYKATFTGGTEGFVNAGWDGGQVEVSNVDGELVATVPAGDGGAVNKADVNSVQEINFAGNLTVKARLFLPEEYSGSEFWMTFFFQSGSWQHFPFGEVDMSGITYGEWNDLQFEITDEDYPEGFSRTLSPQMFGFQYGGTLAGQFKLDDIEIIGDSVVDDLQPIYEQGFSTMGSIDDLAVDFTQGALDSGSMLAAKKPGYHVVPFGWTASTWFDTSALTIADDVQGEVLTERGEEIVNGANGIAETSFPVMFE